MKIIKTISFGLIVICILGVFLGCSGNTDETSAETNVYTVGTGDLQLDISAAGNLALSRTEDLTADLFYPQGTVTEVLIEKGDTVEEGQVLVRIDPDEWQDQIQILEDSFSTSQRQVETRERALDDAEKQVLDCEQALVDAQRNITSKEIQLREAEVNLGSAQYALDSMEEVKEVQDEIDYNESLLEFIDMKMIESKSPGANPGDISFWWDQKDRVIKLLEDLELEKKDILTGNSLKITDTVALEVTRKQLAIEKAQLSLADAQDALAEAQANVETAEAPLVNARTDVVYAQQDLEYAQEDAQEAKEALEEALAMSPEITAPFDGFITRVNIVGGDTVYRGTVLAQIADPDEFKADILVSEMDIFQVEVGTSATIQVDALSGVVYSATVTSISPTATIQSGVVNYEVTVELNSVEDIAADISERRQEAFDDLEPGELPEMLQRAVESGRMTQEEAEERWDQMQSGDFSPPEGFTRQESMEIPEGFTPGESFGSGQQSESQLPSMTITDFQLREGLSVTVSIIVEERTEVILVPNGAVSSEGGEYYVEVITASGETERRVVQTGISDWQYTEITSGLNEGEQVVVPEGSPTAVTESQSGRPGGGFMIPGGLR